ncbi:hypothetical protein, partial [Bartonella sp. AA83SXKL]|uniref:hypothetical protein n=1 Tax=Bartonella sp. AA83SXKL TaxID=3243439 RepID=UPI0035CED34D
FTPVNKPKKTTMARKILKRELWRKNTQNNTDCPRFALFMKHDLKELHGTANKPTQNSHCSMTLLTKAHASVTKEK